MKGDLVFVLLTLLMFGLMFGYVHVCERLK